MPDMDGMGNINGYSTFFPIDIEPDLTGFVCY